MKLGIVNPSDLVVLNDSVGATIYRVARVSGHKAELIDDDSYISHSVGFYDVSLLSYPSIEQIEGELIDG